MIYIFDDRLQRRKANEEKLRIYSDLIKFDTVKLNPGKSADESIFDTVEEPECIFFHKSYALEGENITFETIRQLFSELDVPIIIFSGGIEGSNKSSNEININADLMYNNLQFFLENRKEKGHINIDTLLWGKGYRLNALLEFQNKISRKFLISKDLDDELGDDLNLVKRSIENLCREIQREDLCNSIISYIGSNERITWLDLATIIDKNIRKFQ